MRERAEEHMIFDYNSINFLCKQTYYILVIGSMFLCASYYANSYIISEYLISFSLLTIGFWPLYFTWKKRDELRQERKVIITEENIYFLADSNIKLIKWGNVSEIKKTTYETICIKDKNGNKEIITKDINQFDICFCELYSRAKKLNIKFRY